MSEEDHQYCEQMEFAAVIVTNKTQFAAYSQ